MSLNRNCLSTPVIGLAFFLMQYLPATLVSAQSSVSAGVQVPIPPEVRTLSCFCLAVKCSGADVYEVVKACDPDPAVAEQMAWHAANQMCVNSGGVEHTLPVPKLVCRLIEIPGPDEEMAYRTAQPSGTWVVEGRLYYCDGSPGIKATFSGCSTCEAIRKGREFLCAMKDPCKRGYLKFCIKQSPCATKTCCPR